MSGKTEFLCRFLPFCIFPHILCKVMHFTLLLFFQPAMAFNYTLDIWEDLSFMRFFSHFVHFPAWCARLNISLFYSFFGLRGVCLYFGYFGNFIFYEVFYRFYRFSYGAACRKTNQNKGSKNGFSKNPR